MEIDGFFLIEKHRDIVGVSFPVGPQSEYLVVTDKGVNTYSVTSQRNTFSYTGKPSATSRFTLPALLDFNDNTNYAIRDDRFLWVWKKEIQNIEHDSAKHEYKKKIKAIKGSTTLPGHVLLIFEDGSISLVDSKNTQISHLSTEGTNLLSSNIGTLVKPNGQRELVLCVLNKIKKEYAVTVVQIAKVDKSYQLQAGTTTPIGNRSSISGFTYQPNPNRISILWDSLELEILKFDSEFRTISTRSTLPLDSLYIPNKPIHSMQLGAHGLVIAGTSEEGDISLTMWESVFGTMLAKFKVPKSRGLVLTQLCSNPYVMDNETFVVVFKDTIFIGHHYIPPPALSNVIGTQQPTAPPVHCLNLPKELGLVFKEASSDSIDLTKASGFEEHQKSQSSKDVQFRKKITEEEPEIAIKTILSISKGFDQIGLKLNGHYYGSMLARRLVDQKDWDDLIKLTEAAQISVSVYPELVADLLANNQAAAAYNLLRNPNVQGLSAREMVLLLKYFIKAEKSTLMDLKDNETDEKATLDQIISDILTLRISSLNVQQELCNLDIHEVIVIFTHLQRALFDRLYEHKSSTHYNSLAELVNWVNRLLDSHFSEIILVQECHPVLRELKKISDAQMALVNSAAGIAGMVEYFQDVRGEYSQANIQKKKAESLYFIEQREIKF